MIDVDDELLDSVCKYILNTCFFICYQGVGPSMHGVIRRVVAACFVLGEEEHCEVYTLLRSSPHVISMYL